MGSFAIAQTMYLMSVGQLKYLEINKHQRLSQTYA